MSEYANKIGAWLSKQLEWVDFSGKSYARRIEREQEARNTNPVPEDQATENLRAIVTKLVERGWRIEILNDFDAVLSKKRQFNWILHCILLFVFLFIFPLLALLWLVVMVILAVTRRPVTKRVWVEKNGEVFER
jgi:C4-dicarboxylate-specific signal transduction histidine kinase